VGAAGFAKAQVTSTTWTYGSPSERKAWGDLWAERIVESRFGDRAVELGISDRAGLLDMAVGWRKWAAEPHGWFAFIHGEIVAEKPVREE
jgi:hypothetical protein